MADANAGVRYEVVLDAGQVMSCNCSLCAGLGWLLMFAPPKDLKLIRAHELGGI